MICNNCGNEILEEFGTCPYCKTPIGQNQNSNNKQNYRNNRYIYNKRKQNDTTATTVICIIIAVVSLTLFIILIKNTSIENTKLTKDNFKETLKEYANTEYSSTEGPSDDLAYVMYAILNYSIIYYISNNYEFDDQLTVIYGKTINELKKEGKKLMEKKDVQIENFKIYLRSINGG